MQLAQLLGGPDIDRCLFAETARLVTGHEAEELHVLVQVGEVEIMLGAGVEVVQAEPGKVGDHDVAGQVALLQTGEVVEGLGGCPVEVFAAALVFDEQDALPQQVDVAALAVALLDRFLEAGDAAPGDTEDIEEGIPECLGLGIFAGFVGPFLREGEGTGADFIPRKGHGGQGGGCFREV